MMQDRRLYTMRARRRFKVSRQCVTTHPHPLGARSAQSVSLGANLFPTLAESRFLLQSNQRGSCMVTPARLSHVGVAGTSFEEEPTPLLEDSGYLSQTGQSISLEPSPSVFLESGSVVLYYQPQ